MDIYAERSKRIGLRVHEILLQDHAPKEAISLLQKAQSEKVQVIYNMTNNGRYSSWWSENNDENLRILVHEARKRKYPLSRANLATNTCGILDADGKTVSHD